MGERLQPEMEQIVLNALKRNMSLLTAGENAGFVGDAAIKFAVDVARQHLAELEGLGTIDAQTIAQIKSDNGLNFLNTSFASLSENEERALLSFVEAVSGGLERQKKTKIDERRIMPGGGHLKKYFTTFANSLSMQSYLVDLGVIVRERQQGNSFCWCMTTGFIQRYNDSSGELVAWAKEIRAAQKARLNASYQIGKNGQLTPR